MRLLSRFALLSTTLLAVIVMMTGSSQAGDFVLSNNSGSSSATFFISGEPSLVMNGFDLQPLGIPRPTQLDRVSIDVVSPVAGQSATVVVYQDADGGDPVNATLVGQQAVNITQSGIFTATFNPPLNISQPVIWVGFYLPVDFEFRADRSGTSVLTYWGWSPGTTFDLTNLANAQVFGPGDGSEPVNINMNGIARITAELDTGGAVATSLPTATSQSSVSGGRLTFVERDAQDRIVQVVGDPNTNLSMMTSYGDFFGCGNLYYDTDDIRVNYQFGIQLGCKESIPQLQPAPPDGYVRVGKTYNVTIFGLVSPGTDIIPYPLTHCINMSDTFQDRAVLGLAYGAPHEWEILPTIRFGNFVCTDINYAGAISAFVPS